MAKFFEGYLACPLCHYSVKKGLHGKFCKFKYKKFSKIEDIWEFLSKESTSQLKNENLHKQGSWGRINDGSYEVLASFAKGNKTLDIACGEGWIENLSPETVGLDFSLAALKKAKRNGAKNLVHGSAENLPFIENSFDLAICAGSLENIENPKKAILEMARVSYMQILTVHREFNFPFIKLLRKIFSLTVNLKHQPVETPIKWSALEKMLNEAKLKIVFKGYWTLPINYGKVVSFLPIFTKIPSCFFVVTVKPSKNHK